MSLDFFARLIGMVVLGFGGWELGLVISGGAETPDYMRWVLSLALAGGALGLLLTPYFTTKPAAWTVKQIRQMPASDLLAGTVGLVIGLIISALLALPLSMLPDYFGKVLPFVAAVVLAYLGIATMVMRQRDLYQLLGRQVAVPGKEGKRWAGTGYVVVDTSAIIDGRIADVCRTGFVQGTLLIPRFVLNELQQIADSQDILRRNRGRRGLDMLSKLQKEAFVPVEISDIDFEEIHDVDGKLVKAGKTLRSPIVTNDYNLNRVAELQGVRVLNINELANAVKSVVMPGEEMAVRIIQEGKEVNQGVAYLDDGTMVVVEGGRRFLNNQLDIVVTRVLQTVAGRMIFAQPKVEH